MIKQNCYRSFIYFNKYKDSPTAFINGQPFKKQPVIWKKHKNMFYAKNTIPTTTIFDENMRR